MREQRNHCDRASECDSGCQQRQRRGQQRAEHQEQDDQRRSGTETGAADTGSSRRLRDLAFDLDLDTIPCGCFGGVDELLRLAGRDLRRLLGQRHVRERDLTRVRDLRSLRRCVGRHDRRDIAERCDLREHCLDLAAHGRVGHLALLDCDHDLLTVTSCLRRRLLKQVQRLEALGAREAEAVLVAATDAVTDHAQPDQGDEPSCDHEPAVPDTPSSESSHRRSPFESVSTDHRSRCTGTGLRHECTLVRHSCINTLQWCQDIGILS